MIVPFPRGQQQGQAAQPQPSETDLLMALAAMHANGRIAALTGEGGADPERGMASSFRTDPSQVPSKGSSRKLIPGEQVPDQGQGGTRIRDVRGT